MNNVHPILHSPLYRIIETLIDSLTPLFNRTLIDLRAPGYHNQRIHLADITRDPVVDRDPGQFRPPEQRAYKTWINDQGCYHDYIFVDLKRELWNVGLQMVLQMRDINLMANNPNHDGENWHVQGQNVSQAPEKYVYKLTIGFLERAYYRYCNLCIFYQQPLNYFPTNAVLSPPGPP